MRQNRIWRRSMRSWRYYHGIFWGLAADDFSSAVRALGEQGELVGAASNHFRNLIQHLLTLTTQNRPAFDAIATNADSKSLDQAKVATQMVEYYMTEKRAENLFKTAVEYALVLNSGYIRSVWDPGLGEPIMGDVESGTLLKEGDLEVTVHSPIDIVTDPYAT